MAASRARRSSRTGSKCGLSRISSATRALTCLTPSWHPASLASASAMFRSKPRACPCASPAKRDAVLDRRWWPSNNCSARETRRSSAMRSESSRLASSAARLLSPRCVSPSLSSIGAIGTSFSPSKRAPQAANAAALARCVSLSRVFSSISRESLTTRLRRASAPKASSPSSTHDENILNPPLAMPSMVSACGAPRSACASATLT